MSMILFLKLTTPPMIAFFRLPASSLSPLERQGKVQERRLDLPGRGHVDDTAQIEPRPTLHVLQRNHTSFHHTKEQYFIK
jgi:hypothetical protein